LRSTSIHSVHRPRWKLVERGWRDPFWRVGQIADGDTLATDTICVPPGCYKLKVFDSNSDGMGAGGYVLTNGNGERIIDANGAFGAVSFAKTTFCLPLGEPHLIEADCDQVLTDGDAITSSSVAGATQYRFLVFDPHGSYKRSFFRANGVLGSNALAQLPTNLELNVRISAFGPGLDHRAMGQRAPSPSSGRPRTTLRSRPRSLLLRIIGSSFGQTR
jgi:hypothetical protein